jgi:hypothetical protein
MTTKAKGTSITRNKKRIAQQAAAGKGTPEIAASLGLSRITIWRALQDPEVQAAIADFRSIMLAAVSEDIERGLRACLTNCIRGLEKATGAEAQQLQDRMLDLIDRLQPVPVVHVQQPQAGGFIETTASRGGAPTGMTLREALISFSRRDEESPTQ